MLHRDKIKDLLKQTRGFKHLAETYEDEAILEINHTIWDNILNELGIENEMNKREDYYEVFADYEFGIIDELEVINRIKLLLKG